MEARGSILRIVAGFLFTIAIGASEGCNVDLAATLNPPADNGGAGEGSSGGDSVLVVFRNLTDSEAVEVEFYTTAEPLEVVPDDLFDPANGYLVVRNIGVGGRGIIAPGETDQLELDCVEGLTLGTTGGLFVDNETGDELGTGTSRWVQEGAQISCGAIVILEYTKEGEAFRTDLLLGAGDS